MLIGRASVDPLLRVMALASALYWATHTYLTSFAVHWPSTFASLSLLAYGGEFALGGLLCLTIAERRFNGRSCFIACAFCSSISQIVFGPSGAVAPGWRGAVPALIWIAAVAAIVAGARWNDAATGMFGRQTKAIRLIGLATYPLYLLHNEIGTAAIVSLEVSPWLIMAIMIGASIGVAACLEPAIQIPLKAWLNVRAAASPL